MTSRRVRRTIARLAGVGISATVVMGVVAVPAYADTSAASANAATLSLSGGTLLTTGVCAATSTGGAPGPSCGNATFTGSPLSVGLFAQQAGATGTTPSLGAACAGAVAKGAVISISASGTCAFTPAAPSGGVTVDLGAVATLHADAIVAECSALSTGAPTVLVHLVNATVSLLVDPTHPVPLTSTPAKDTKLLALLGGIVNITLNDQTGTPQPAVGNGIATTALRLNLLGILPGAPPLVSLSIGTVSCQAVATAPSPAFPIKGLPIAGAMLLVAGYLGWRFWWLPRRRTESTPA